MPASGNAQQLSLWPGIGHRNHYLFSDYYLNARLPMLELWQNPLGLSAAFVELKNLWASIQDNINITTAKEPQTREYLIDPVLRILGHVYEPEPSLPTDHSVKAPDYALFLDRNSMSRAVSRRGSIDYFRHTLAVAEAKRYGRPLDQKSREGTDPFDNNNPSFQIDYYLRATGLRWGILTDGRYWRLYNRDTSFKLNSYYEVDLVSLIKQSNEQALKYFFLFFRREAFSGTEKCESFLDRVFEESARYAAAIGSKLKDAVYEALETLCEGFIRFQRNNLDSRLQLNDIYNNSLVLLYRLLFIFYAESRGLLPLDTNRSYSDNYSLNHLKKDIAKCIDDGVIIPPDWTSYWSQLKDLFKAINEGSPAIDVYEYNGGLFDPYRHEFLEKHDIGDLHLAKAIDLLARADTDLEKKRDFVDYRDLDIKHLGSIYEGLLEHKPQVADEEMVIIKEKGKEKVIPRTGLKGQRVYGQKTKGEIYLALEKGERKATGSYYTPDYIVKYIVENTLEPLLLEKVDTWQSRVAELETKIKVARGENRQLLEKELKSVKYSVADEILSLKVLDPAMGSGHFLVRATEYLAEELATNPHIPPPSRDWAIEDVDYWKRRVVEHCIYGVDINPLAVELAKVSLWLSTVAKNKPLSFLDHHLRCGNSLVGASLEDLDWLPMKKEKKSVPSEQLALFDKEAFTKDIGLSVGDLVLIQSLPSETIEDIKEKDRILKELVESRRLPYKQLADLWVSHYFDNEMDQKLYSNLALLIQGKESQLSTPQAQLYLDKAESLAEKKRFFHWEVEFPEVFFDRNGQRLPDAGFSAIVGNPPYGYRTFQDIKLYLGDNYAVGESENIAEYFVQKSIDICSDAGFYGMILPKQITYVATWRAIRQSVVANRTLRSIVDATEAFEDVLLEQAILICGGSVKTDTYVSGVIDGNRIKILGTISQTKLSSRIWPIYAFSQFDSLMFKVESSCVDLATLYQIHHGLKNIRPHMNYREGERILRGDNISRYACNDDIMNLSSQYITDADRRRHCREKVVVQQIVAHVTEPAPHIILMAWFDDTESLIFETLNTVLPKTPNYSLQYLLAIINSKWNCWFVHRFIFNMAVRTMMYRKGYLDYTPVRRISFTTPEVERKQLLEEGKTLYQEYLQTTDWKKTLRFVSERLPQKPDGTPDIAHEQSDVVHDLLTSLAEEMTRLYKEKQAEMKGFLNWLEAHLGINIEDLKNKTKIKEYYKVGVGWEGFLGSLEQNRGAIQLAKGIDVSRREPQETIRAEFDASVAKLKPVLETIELTDKLIDQIVYQLYGLTEAEIAVVEGRS